MSNFQILDFKLPEEFIYKLLDVTDVVSNNIKMDDGDTFFEGSFIDEQINDVYADESELRQLRPGLFYCGRDQTRRQIQASIPTAMHNVIKRLHLNKR
ncbi:hypothetical protein PGB90_003653 [Kerria lacca]